MSVMSDVAAATHAHSACANTSPAVSAHIGQLLVLGSYLDKIHLAMGYTAIFRSHIVYSMRAYKALSIVAINYLCIRQIPRTESTTKSNTLPK